jgi:hypothetical protein
MTDQGKNYSEFVSHNAELEQSRRSSLDARGVGILTSNGAVTTLIFGILAVIKGENFVLTTAARWGVIVTLALLMVSAFFGMYATRLIEYEIASIADLQKMTGELWTSSETTARNICAASTISTVDTLRKGNNTKASRVSWAINFQLSGFVVLAVSVIIELWP